jgi:hypothetical protein
MAYKTRPKLRPPFDAIGNPQPGDLGSLCLDCGLCCMGAIFPKVRINDSEIKSISSTDMRIYRRDDQKGKLAALMPCPCHNGKCTIYDTRPDSCSMYRCDLLKGATNGSIDIKEAKCIAEKAKQQFFALLSMAKEYDYTREERPSLRNVLDRFADFMLPRAKLVGLGTVDYRFAASAFQFLQLIDRHFEPTNLVARFSDLLAASKDPRFQINSGGDDDHVLHLPDVGIRIRFCDSQEILSSFTGLLNGWEKHVRPFDNKFDEPECIVWKSEDGYRLSSTYPHMHIAKRGNATTAARIIDTLIYRSLDLYLHANPNSFYIHSSAMVGRDGLTVFMGTNKTGKSTLCLSLVRAGYKLFCDDRFSVHLGCPDIFSVGLGPMVRLRVPDRPDFVEHSKFVDSNIGIRSDTFCYLKLDQELWATHGEQGRVKSIVLLSMSKEPVETKLQPIQKHEALNALLDRHYERYLNQSKILDTLIAIVEETSVYNLTYSNLDEATEVAMKVIGEK